MIRKYFFIVFIHRWWIFNHFSRRFRRKKVNTLQFVKIELKSTKATKIFEIQSLFFIFQSNIIYSRAFWFVISTAITDCSIEIEFAMNSFISIHKFETPQTSRKKIERRVKIDKIKISTFKHDDAKILTWFDFEQNQKSAENDFEIKKKFIHFFLSFIFISFTLRHKFTMNKNNFVFWISIINSKFDVFRFEFISEYGIIVYLLHFQRYKKWKLSRNRFAIELFSISVRVFSV